MGLIPDETINEIRSRADLVTVIGQHVELKKAGRNHKGLCPFHGEKTPSFNVNGDKGFYYCFGCQQKGDVFSFVMEYEGKSFIEAAESLASQFGVTIPETGETREQSTFRRSEKSQMLAINALAVEFFRGKLQESAGADARAYLEGRGIGDQQIATFQLGYAPADWHALADFLAARGASLDVAEMVGLIIRQPRKSGYYDRFRHRLVCPIIATNGEVLGFSGRRLASDEDEKAGAKYINSPESAIYKKSKLLYGIHLAREAFREAKRAILVEGNFDVVRLHQAGFTETVAPLGTALTSEQASQLRRLVGRVVLLYDGDRAGRAATLKGLQTLLEEQVDVRIASLPAGEDPDSLVGREGGDALRQILDRAQPAVEYFIHEVWSQVDPSAQGRAQALQEAAQVLKSISDPTQRDFAIGTFSAALGVDEQALRRGLRRALLATREARPAETRPMPPATPQNNAPPPRLELDIVAILAEYPELLAQAEEGDVFSCLTDSRLRDMYSAARAGTPMLSVTSDPQIAKRILAGDYANVHNPEQTFGEAIKTLRAHRRRHQQTELQRQVEQARRRGDTELERKLVSEILKIGKQVD